MTVYVDALMHNGWQMHGLPIQSCHMFSDTEDHDELHAIAQAIGLKRAWFRNVSRTPHYDLTPGKRAQAIAAGAIPVGRSLAVRIWRSQRARAREEPGMNTSHLSSHSPVGSDDAARSDAPRCLRFRDDDPGSHRSAGGKKTDDGVAAADGEAPGIPSCVEMRNDGTKAGAGGVRPIYRFHFGWSAAARSSHFNLTAPRQKELRGMGSAEIRRGAAPHSNGAASTKIAPQRSTNAIEHRRQKMESES